MLISHIGYNSHIRWSQTSTWSATINLVFDDICDAWITHMTGQTLLIVAVGVSLMGRKLWLSNKEKGKINEESSRLTKG